MNRVMAFEVCSTLEEDQEFALRVGAVTSPSQRVDLLAAYFRARGIDEGDTQVLIVAYIAGNQHALTWVGRALDRAEKPL